MLNDFTKDIQKKMDAVVEGRRKEMAQIRTGRATPALLDTVQVECYGGHQPLRQVANITVVEGRILTVQPWDRSIVGACEKALQKADLGAAPQNDGTLLRLALPPLSEERRKELVKLAKKLGEEGKVSLRNLRHDANKRLDKMKEDEDVPEDTVKKAHTDIQKMVDDHSKKIDEIIKAKEDEILHF